MGIFIASKTKDTHRRLNIPEQSFSPYLSLIKEKLCNDFWNEIVGEKEIVFIFKFKDGRIEQYNLSQETEKQIDKLCAKFNAQPLPPVTNVYKWLSENEHYQALMLEHYGLMISRQ